MSHDWMIKNQNQRQKMKSRGGNNGSNRKVLFHQKKERSSPVLEAFLPSTSASTSPFLYLIESSWTDAFFLFFREHHHDDHECHRSFSRDHHDHHQSFLAFGNKLVLFRPYIMKSRSILIYYRKREGERERKSKEQVTPSFFMFVARYYFRVHHDVLRFLLFLYSSIMIRVSEHDDRHHEHQVPLLQPSILPPLYASWYHVLRGKK